jgi:hypothetical protein
MIVAFRSSWRDFFYANWRDPTSPPGWQRGRGPENTPNGAEDYAPDSVEIDIHPRALSFARLAKCRPQSIQ